MSAYRIWHPEVFQGMGRRKNYFEGWYYKLIDKGNENVLGIIPGIALGRTREDSHAFIQIFDAGKGKTHYLYYPLNAFSANKRVFQVRIAGNLFTEEKMVLDIQNHDIGIRAELMFDEIEKYPQTLLSPGIMGPFSFLPFMECHHGIVNMRHRIHGKLTMNGRPIDFEDGEGYVEKDWGRSFPSAWIWAQANHFADAKASFMFSLANIPFMGREFRGMIAFFKDENRFARFATYNFSKLRRLSLNADFLEIGLESRQFILSAKIKRAQGYLLKAPESGRMVRMIEETIGAEASLVLTDKDGSLLFEGASPNCGLEISEKAESVWMRS